MAESGRSSQVFVMDVIAKRGSEARRSVARGRHIYAITAPNVVEATERVAKGLAKPSGVGRRGRGLRRARLSVVPQSGASFLRALGMPLCPAQLVAVVSQKASGLKEEV